VECDLSRPSSVSQSADECQLTLRTRNRFSIFRNVSPFHTPFSFRFPNISLKSSTRRAWVLQSHQGSYFHTINFIPKTLWFPNANEWYLHHLKSAFFSCPLGQLVSVFDFEPNKSWVGSNPKRVKTEKQKK
jgi:hypothetical protein